MTEGQGFSQTLRRHLLQSWEQPSWLSTVLWPLSLIYLSLFNLKRALYRTGILTSYRAPVPVIVVGNITVGGTGKTPMVIYLIELLREMHFRPGVISRGYAGNAPSYPFIVDKTSDASICGDEPAMIVDRTNVPMVIGPDRTKDVEMLVKEFDVDIVISDDGLQHFALERDIEVCLHNVSRDKQNSFLLPAGPYREPKAKLRRVDLLVTNGEFTEFNRSSYQMSLSPKEVTSVTGANCKIFDANRGVHAVAGIGSPHRFFETCRSMNWQIVEHIFNDHHSFVPQDFAFNDDLPIVMTQKDAIKCRNFDHKNLWYLPVDVNIDDTFSQHFKKLLKSIDAI